jgi:hypothetical protein
MPEIKSPSDGYEDEVSEYYEPTKEAERRLRMAQSVIESFPDLKKLCEAVLFYKDISTATTAAMELNLVGLAICDVFFYGVGVRDELRHVIHDAEVIPIMLPSVRTVAYQQIDFIYKALGLGQNLKFKTVEAKTGGRKPFNSPLSPSLIAFRLFHIMERFVIPKEDTERWDKHFRETKSIKDALDRDAPYYLENSDRLALSDAIVSLPKLTGTTAYVDWAEAGAWLLVDHWSAYLRLDDDPLPALPAKWVAAAAKRKGKKGALRDIVRKKLEIGFKAITPV